MQGQSPQEATEGREPVGEREEGRRDEALRGSRWWSRCVGNPRDPVMREEGERAPSPEQKARFWETALSIVFPKSPIKWDESYFSHDQNQSPMFGGEDLEDTNEPTEENRDPVSCHPRSPFVPPAFSPYERGFAKLSYVGHVYLRLCCGRLCSKVARWQR